MNSCHSSSAASKSFVVCRAIRTMSLCIIYSGKSEDTAGMPFERTARSYMVSRSSCASSNISAICSSISVLGVGRLSFSKLHRYTGKSSNFAASCRREISFSCRFFGGEKGTKGFGLFHFNISTLLLGLFLLYAIICSLQFFLMSPFYISKMGSEQ